MIVQRFRVRVATIDQKVETLSGGNLQKFIVGREVLPEPRVLLLDQPTWGVDAGSAASIRNELIALRAAGCAILIVSEDIDELYELADRLIVMAGGSCVGLADTTANHHGRARPLDGRQMER